MVSPPLLVSAAAFLLFSPFFIFPSRGVTLNMSCLAYAPKLRTQAQNQEYCMRILQSDPRSSSADLPLLSLISLELAIPKAHENYQTFVQYQKNSTEKGLRDSFGNCVTNYQDMKDKLQADHQYSQRRQFDKITDLGGLTDFAYNCENGLPLGSPTASITEDMLLTLQTAIYVNEYVQSNPGSNLQSNVF